MRDKVIVITGASAGIGAALAEFVHQRGAKPVLVARRLDALKAVAARSGDAQFIVADLTRRDEVAKVVKATIERHGHIDVWVNNAGRGISRKPTELTDADLDDMMTVNVKSAFYGMQEVLPHMKERGVGHIINVSSMLGRVPFALVRSAYSASKHFLNALTANFRMEVKASHPNIHISLFSPGAVATEFGVNALHGGLDNRKIPGAQSAEEVAEGLAKLIEAPRADVYSRSGYQETVVGYYSAEDMGAVEQRPPFVR